MTEEKKTRKRAKKKVKKTSKKAAKKESEKPILDLSSIKIKGMDASTQKKSIKVLTKDNKKDEIPYRIPFKNKALDLATGSIIGGTFCEIGAESQGGKSFLGYELMATCQAMGGFVTLNDGEGAFETPYADMVGLDLESGSFALTSISDINQAFAYWTQFILAIRKNRKKIYQDAPILIVQDSFVTLQTSMSLDNVGKGEALGYEAMQRNQAFSREMEKFIVTLKANRATMVMINQFTKNTGAGLYEDPYHSLCEEKMQYFSTQRLKGKLSTKLKKTIKIAGKEIKEYTGVKTRWTTIKNRSVKPFQTVTVAIRYASGISEESGLLPLMFHNSVLKFTESKKINGEALDKAVPMGVLNTKYTNGEEFKIEVDKKTLEPLYANDVQLMVEKYPSVLEPIWTGTYDDGEDEEEPIDLD